MGSFKLGVICMLPGVIDILQVINHEKQEFDLVLIFILIICSANGSNLQIVNKSLIKKIEVKGVITIYTTGLMVIILGYLLGIYTQKLFWGALFTTLVSYMSLDLFKAVKTAREYIRYKLNIKKDDN